MVVGGCREWQRKGRRTARAARAWVGAMEQDVAHGRMTDQRSLADKAVTLGKGTLASRVLGFVRDASIAALLGGGWVADALLVAFRLPNIARTLLAEGAFAYTLVPVYGSLRVLDPQRALGFGRTMATTLFVLFCLIALAGALFSDHIALVLAPGFHTMPDVLEMASELMVLCLFSLPLVSGAAVSAAILMAEGHFKVPAYSSMVFNAVIILAAGLAFVFYSAGDSRIPYLLCYGAIVAGITQWGYQAAGLRRAGVSLSGPVAFGDPAVRQSLRTLPQSVFGVGGYHINILLATFLASFLAEGTISSLYFAERLIGFPLGVIGASIGLAALSDLSAMAAPLRATSGEKSASVVAEETLFSERLAKAGRIVLFFALPAAVGTACLALPLTSAIFGHGAFDQNALQQTSRVLLAYLVGLPALAFARPLLAGLAALDDAGSVMRGAFAGFAATGAFGLVLLVTGIPWGPALAVSLAAWTSAAVLTRALIRRGHNPLPGPVWAGKSLVASLVMGACVLWAAGMVSSSFGKVALVPLGVAVYLVTTFALHLEESSFVFHTALRILQKIR